MFVLEDNMYAMSTKRQDAIAGDIAARIRGFNINTVEIERYQKNDSVLLVEKKLGKEAATTGVGVGLALNGKISVVEMMFGDFITLAFDQLLNYVVKYGWVYGDNISVPIIIRAPMGAKRGYYDFPSSLVWRNNTDFSGLYLKYLMKR